MRKPWAALPTFLGVVLAAGTGQAKTVEFLSRHPIPPQHGAGFCYIEVAHLHNYGPADPRLYREINGQFYFVGDPSPFQFEGPRYSYFGAHPVVEAEVTIPAPVYCYLRGPHYHPYQPPAHAAFQFKGGAYWFVGVFPPAFHDERPRYAGVNDAYARVRYARPVVDVRAAPVGFRGEIAVGGPGLRATAVVGTEVPPPPSLQLGIGISLGGGPGSPPRAHPPRGPRRFHPARPHAHRGPALFRPSRSPGRPLRVHYDPRQDISRQPVHRATPARSRGHRR